MSRIKARKKDSLFGSSAEKMGESVRLGGHLLHQSPFTGCRTGVATSWPLHSRGGDIGSWKQGDVLYNRVINRSINRHDQAGIETRHKKWHVNN